MFSRLQARLDRLENHAHISMDEVVGMVRDFLDDLEDGVQVSASVEEHAAKELMQILLGKAGQVPLNLQIDPTYDTLPGSSARFIGGDHDGKQYRLGEDQRKRVIILQPGQVYVWDGHNFQYDGDSKVQEPAEQ